MPHWKFIGQEGEFITGRDGSGVPGRDLSQEDYDSLPEDAKEALTDHIDHNPHPVYEYHDDELPAPELVAVPEEPAPAEPPVEVTP